MKPSLPRGLALSLVAYSCMQAAQAQIYLPPEAAPYTVAQAGFSQQELDAMLAPIALYPDALLAQVLMAATYPLEIVEAARWSRAIPGVNPQEAVRSVAQRGWDASVQSLMAFPQVLQMMDQSLDWTQRLGNAFLAQQAQVWSTVQALRQRAYAAGQLRSSAQLRVLYNGNVIVLESADPDVVYVPYYDPLVVYGRWWWPDYSPMRWDPWPGYRRGPGRGAGFYSGPGVQIGLGFFFGQINWATHRVTVLPDADRRDRHAQPWQPGLQGHDWQHDPQHRGNLPYTNPPPRPAPHTPNLAPPTRLEAQPEFRGHMPNPRTQVEPQPQSPRPAAPEPVDRTQGKPHTAPAPSVQPPGPRAVEPVVRPVQPPVQNAAPGGGERPVSHRAPEERKAPAEPRVAPKEPVQRQEERERP